ncbi:MAG TPA: PQQ-dependent sugar dehydrogenase [Thermoanaerobaculia bacterium]|nr:PQQ-dependent sugar dehydrogenase [Thermoanaerobaculia bacterium]
MRRVIPLAALCLASALPLLAQPPALTLTPVVAGLDDPVAITHAGDSRLFVTLQDGRVVIVANGQLLAQPFLDLRDRVLSGGERGLLSVAFHPRYAENGFLFVDYTNLAGDTVISRFQVGNDPDRVPAGSERILLTIEQPFANHNGGQLQFGPDGYLYVGMGDGGAAFDPQCRAQDGGELLGKLLRLDVDVNVDAAPYHGIPPSNPFVGAGNRRDEIWASGLRNPWRFSFDRVSGDLYLGDVGQNSREEVSFQPAGSPGGENYGWKVWEGDLCLGSTAGCSFPVPACGSPAYTAPILTYGHDDGSCAVTGGSVYRGQRIPGLSGWYLYGDFCSGRVRAARRLAAGWTSHEVLDVGSGLTSFGEDRDGELYLAAGGTIYRLGGPPLPTSCTPAPGTLCLGGGRFLVQAEWRTAQGPSGMGTATALTADSGYFTFFDAANPELFVKVIDACGPPFERRWVFAAGLTDVEVTLVVIDTQADRARVYTNPLGRAYLPVQDTDAFATCP